jgi:hypothetical protein
MRIERFEDIVAWQKAKELTLLVYQLFKDNRDFGFKDQIQRASISIMNNIAEGFERHTDEELDVPCILRRGRVERSDRCYLSPGNWDI